MCEQWPRDKIMNLITVYRAKECLWKASSKGYTDRNKRNNAWENVAKTIGSDVRSVEKKIKTLKTQFMYYYKQVLKKRVNGKTDSAYTPQWFAYDALQFLQREKEVRALGPEEASKSRPSNLSIDVWHLMENARKNDCYADRSDENSQDIDGSTNFQAILDKLTSSSPEISIHEIKLEASNDEYLEETNQSDPLQRTKDEEMRGNEPMQFREQTTGVKRNDTIHYIGENVEEYEGSYNAVSPPGPSQKEQIERAVWNFEAAQKEHNLKLQMLNIELERAELQKQTALNELTTSELKKQLIENQAAEFYSQVRMIGERGSGAGKGGGGGGTIREAGGAFGKMEVAHEEQYFYEQQKEQLKKLREGLHDEISFHEEQIKRHQEAIDRHKKTIGHMDPK